MKHLPQRRQLDQLRATAQLVHRQIEKRGPVSKREILRHSGFTHATVDRAIADLYRDDLIEMVEIEKAGTVARLWQVKP